MSEYFEPKDLANFADMGKEAPELGAKFFEYGEAVFEEAELTTREKALIGLAVAHTTQCPYCIEAMTQKCLENGSSPGEMTEAVHVACYIRGGSSLVHGMQMRKHIEKLSM